jgi:crossover junction endodeoxyribonuclease RusA
VTTVPMAECAASHPPPYPRFGRKAPAGGEWSAEESKKISVEIVEIAFPLEFLVSGTPLSLQAKGRRSKIEWRARVKDASYTVFPQGQVAVDCPISVTLFYFPDTEMQGDIDNIVKPILDALTKHIYVNDKQIERVWVQKFEPGKIFGFSSPSNVLMEAIQGEKPLLYVRLSDDTSEGLSHAVIR